MALDTTNCLINGGTWTTVQTYLGAGTSEQGYVEELIDAASWRANTETRRKLLHRSLTEYYDGEGGDTLVLRQTPVTSITSLYLDTALVYGSDTLVDTDDYTFHEEAGLLVLTGTVFPVGVKSIKVTYGAGYSTVPADLEFAVIELVLDMYKRFREKRVGITSITVEGRSVSYVADLPGNVAQTFKNYRRWMVG